MTAGREVPQKERREMQKRFLRCGISLVAGAWDGKPSRVGIALLQSHWLHSEPLSRCRFGHVMLKWWSETAQDWLWRATLRSRNALRSRMRSTARCVDRWATKSWARRDGSSAAAALSLLYRSVSSIVVPQPHNVLHTPELTVE